MKPFTIPKFLLPVLICGMTAVAYENAWCDDNTGNSSRTIVIRPKTPIGQRQKSPSRQQVSCTYTDGNLYFEFAIQEGGCQLILSDLATGETVGASFDSAVTEPVYVGYHSTGTLTVTTANGNTYTGIW